MERKFSFEEKQIYGEEGRIILDKIKFGLRGMIGASVVNDLEFKIWSDMISENIIYQLRGFLLGKNETAVIEYYATWWQEIRLRVLPKWWLKKKPSKIKQVVFKSHYPSLNISGQEHEPRINFMTETRNGYYLGKRKEGERIK